LGNFGGEFGQGARTYYQTDAFNRARSGLKKQNPPDIARRVFATALVSSPD
jgi:hypothetical protein